MPYKYIIEYKKGRGKSLRVKEGKKGEKENINVIRTTL